MKETSSKTAAKKTSRKRVTKPIKPEIIEVVETPVVATKPILPTWAIIAGLALVAIIYAYIRYWNIAVVNGIAISRLSHYQAMQQQVGEQTLDSLITEALISDAAEKANFQVNQQLIDDQIATISAEISAQGKTLEDVLAAEKISLAEVKRQFTLQQIVETLGKGEVNITEADVDQYLADNKDSLPANLDTATLRQSVKTQLENQKASENIASWLTNLKTNAKITR